MTLDQLLASLGDPPLVLTPGFVGRHTNTSSLEAARSLTALAQRGDATVHLRGLCDECDGSFSLDGAYSDEHGWKDTHHECAICGYRNRIDEDHVFVSFTYLPRERNERGTELVPRREPIQPESSGGFPTTLSEIRSLDPTLASQVLKLVDSRESRESDRMERALDRSHDAGMLHRAEGWKTARWVGSGVAFVVVSVFGWLSGGLSWLWQLLLALL